VNSTNTINAINTKHFLLTIDVEDWFQVENFKPWIPFSTWDERELRVEKNTCRLLNLFDSVEVSQSAKRIAHSDSSIEHRGETAASDIEEPSNFRRRRISSSQFHQEIEKKNKSYKSSKSCLKETTKNGIKSTFFILGWIAEKLPHLVREIHSRGHEVASHGCNHQLPDQLSADELKQDLTDSKKQLEDITRAEVHGYRAPSFAVSVAEPISSGRSAFNWGG